MRQLTGFLALTTAWAYLSARPTWNRALLIGSSIPIAMTANVVRVTLTGRHHLRLRPEVRLGGVPHLRGAGDDGPGPADARDLQLGPRPDRPPRSVTRRCLEAGRDPGLTSTPIHPPDRPSRSKGRPTMKAIGRATLVPRACWPPGSRRRPALESLSRIERPPLRRPLASLPMDLGGWAGQDEPIDPEILERVAGDRVHQPGLRRTRNSRACALSLWINYSLHGTNMRHSPEICLPSHGWTKVESMTRGPADRRPRRQGRRRSAGWPMRKVNWSRRSGSGTTSSGKAGSSAGSGPADHQPEQPRTDDPGLGPDGRGLLDERGRPRFAGLPRLRPGPARRPRPDHADRPRRVSRPLSSAVSMSHLA